MDHSKTPKLFLSGTIILLLFYTITKNRLNERESASSIARHNMDFRSSNTPTVSKSALSHPTFLEKEAAQRKSIYEAMIKSSTLSSLEVAMPVVVENIPRLNMNFHPSLVPTVNMSATSHPIFNLNTPAFFEKEAATRKSLFESGLRSSNPSVSEVFLPLVPEVFCPSLVRVGSAGDGGKWVCNPWAMPNGGLVFSLGSNSEISFEIDFQLATGQAASIITVDVVSASSDALAGLSSINAKFVHAMIAPKTELKKVPPHYTVQDIMKKMGHEHIEILKMDIEGGEVAALPQFLEGNTVCQILVEIHEIDKMGKLMRDLANAGFLLLNYELNAFWTGQGLADFSFIHEQCLTKYRATLLASYIKE